MIKTTNLTYGYTKSYPILKGIDLSLEKGHIYGLFGKNGVGKSTLLKVLTGALLGQGEYEVGGLDPRHREAEFLQSFRMVPENEAIFNLTIEELAKVTRPLYPTFSQQILDEALKEFDVPTQQKLTHLSLGQQKKALISLTLACNTPYIFMDEPTNGMDIPSKRSFRKLVAGMADENRTIVISTHQVDDLEGLIDCVIFLENDGVRLSASIEEMGQQFGTEDIKEVFCQVISGQE
ncbi:MAG: ABC transporter ATP-binding protein [Bacteroidales bacterium]|nr:ABC transporter ATP-binding protein [Candidatus Liminaster caballi]